MCWRDHGPKQGRLDTKPIGSPEVAEEKGSTRHQTELEVAYCFGTGAVREWRVQDRERERGREYMVRGG